jgi:acetolactate synthase-1/2/3 large subunit
MLSLNQARFSRKALIIRNEKMKGADMLIKRLEKNGVSTLFAYPGGCNIPIYNSLKTSTIKSVLCRHEQAGAFMAEGYAKSSGKVGVVCTTSGPGATNLVTAIVDSAMDSVPVVCITGQVNSTMLGLDSFQEVGFTDMVNDYCKNVFKVTHASQIPRIVDEAFFLATYGRPGPVVIDIPKDIQNQEHDYNEFEPVLNLNKHTRNMSKSIGSQTIYKFTELIKNSKRPVFYIGGGCIDAYESLKDILKYLRIPVVSTLMGLGTISKKDHEYYLGMIGMHGTIAANYAVHTCDLLIAIGVRFDDRVTGKLETFASNAKIIHIDIDSKEIGKNKEVELAICSDADTFLKKIVNECVVTHFSHNGAIWYNMIINDVNTKFTQWNNTLKSDNLTGTQVIMTINWVCKNMKINPIISTGVGQHQMFTAQHFEPEIPRSIITSGGFGTMGFGLCSAIGTYYAHKDKIIIDIDGDGSFLMNIQELATVATEKVPVKIIIINNQRLGMVTQWGDRFHHYSDYTNLGLKDEPNTIYPDFVTIAKGFSIKSHRVDNLFDLETALINMFNNPNEPYLLDVIVKNTEVLPFIPANGGYNDIIVE